MTESNSPPQMALSQFSTTARPPITPPHSSSTSLFISIAPPPPPSSLPLSLAQLLRPPSPSHLLPTLSLNSFIDLNQLHQDNQPHPPLATSITVPPNPLIDLNQDAEQDQACTDEFLLYNSRNFVCSKVPVRIMFFKNKLWNDFNGEVLESLRHKFASGKTIVSLKIKGVKYAFDFLRMLQVHIQTNNHRSIAWFDENGKPFFPGKFIDCDFSKLLNTTHASKLDYNNDDDDVVITRFKHASKFPNTRLLCKTEKTYLYIKSLFMNNVGKIDPNASIIRIHDLNGASPIARARWSAFKEQVEITEVARGKENVVYGWYAAPLEKVVSIFNNGFRLIRNYPEVRPSIGAGIFVANLESPQHSGMQHQVEKDEVKYLVLCRIVLGRMERVDLESHQTHASNKGYDTGCDDPKNPHWYVVWGNDINRRILPVCAITCKTSVIKDVKWEMTPVEMTMVPRFYLEIKKRVPIECIPPLQDIYDIYKKDGMNMEVFKKHVKELLGEQKMAQIFKEIYDGEI